MAIKVTYQWSDEKLSKAPPWTGHKAWIVSGTTDPDEACAAVDATDPALRVAQLNDPWKPGSPMLCGGPRIEERAGPGVFKVAADFRIHPAGQIPQQEQDPLLDPPVYQWEEAEITIPADIDLDGSPIVNTAGFPLDPMPLTVGYWILHCWRYEPDFDTAKADAYRNKANSHAMTIAGRPVAVEHCRCASMRPEGVYQATTPHVRMHYIFEIFFGDDLGKYPFQHKAISAGYTGWWDDDGTKRADRFSDGRGEVLNEPVRLDSDGTPLGPVFSHVKVGPGNADPVGPPKVTTLYEMETRADATWLWFKRTKLADLRELGL